MSDTMSESMSDRGSESMSNRMSKFYQTWILTLSDIDSDLLSDRPSIGHRF